MSFQTLEVVRTGAVAQVTIKGARGNAMGPDFFAELPRAFDELDRDDAVRAVLLRGDGRHFSSGLDLGAAMGELGPLIAGPPGARERSQLRDLIRRWQDAVSSVERCRKPVVAAISGACIGGAIDLVTACDIRICATDARFSVREVRMAIVADVGTLQRLPKIVGQGHARHLALTGEDFDAAHAARIGLVTAVHAPDQLFDEARAVCEQIAANPPLTVQGTKQILNDCDGLTVEQGLRHVAAWNAAFLPSNDLAEAFSAFLEKRAPEFKGE